MPTFNIISEPYNYIGVVFIIIGLYLISSSHFIFKKHGTPEKFQPSTCVVNSGIYRISRNPMYLGGVVFLIGLAVFLTNVISMIIPVMFFLIIDKMFIPFEEEKMGKECGKDYSIYKKNVRRWI